MNIWVILYAAGVLYTLADLLYRAAAYMNDNGYKYTDSVTYTAAVAGCFCAAVGLGVAWPLFWGVILIMKIVHRRME